MSENKPCSIILTPSEFYTPEEVAGQRYTVVATLRVAFHLWRTGMFTLSAQRSTLVMAAGGVVRLSHVGTCIDGSLSARYILNRPTVEPSGPDNRY